jgi:hypothetical protein
VVKVIQTKAPDPLAQSRNGNGPRAITPDVSVLANLAVNLLAAKRACRCYSEVSVACVSSAAEFLSRYTVVFS